MRFFAIFVVAFSLNLPLVAAMPMGGGHYSSAQGMGVELGFQDVLSPRGLLLGLSGHWGGKGNMYCIRFGKISERTYGYGFLEIVHLDSWTEAKQKYVGVQLGVNILPLMFRVGLLTPNVSFDGLLANFSIGVGL